jgi:7-cyano-7-deazaguanine reductase
MVEQDFKQLGKESTYCYDRPEASVLEVFPNPFADESQNTHRVVGKLHIEVPEFTTLCPITGQPDFATIVIDYQPGRLCVESKSLKLYLGRYRQEPTFHEACVNKIANDLISVLDPLYIKVEGRFTPRGGIPLWPSAEYTKS